jgi:hypothetical chaperone protein
VWHQIPFLRSPKTAEVLARMRATSSDPARIDALTNLLDGNYTFFLYREIERAKGTLSSQESAMVRFLREQIAIDEIIHRAGFERAIATDLAVVQRCMQGVLRAAGVRPADIRSVFLTGGSAQIPVVRRMFADQFGAHSLKSHDYLTTVAFGLGLTAWSARAA